MRNESLVTSHASRIIQVVESGLQPAGIEPLVTRSWHRCLREYGIEPSAPRQISVLNPQSVKQLQEGLGQLLPVARAEMESLYEQIAGSGFAVILADTQGAVLSTITDPALQREFRHAGLSLGAMWDERHEGTNGIGTCLAESGPVTVHREEHFRGYNLSLSCSAAPILDPHGGILAVLDASTANSSDSRLIQRHTMALVNMSAHLISRWNFLNEYRHSWILRFHSRPEFVGLLHEALMAIDDEGNILACQRKRAGATRLLEPPLSGRRADRQVFPVQLRRAGAAREVRAERDLAGPRCCARPALLRDRARARARRRARRCRGRTSSARPPRRRSSASMWGKISQMRKNLACGRQLFAKQVPILLHGATGTGKEAFAKNLHRGSLWSDKPFVTVNCAAIPESLIESELFGYTRGAFTGAAKEGRVGKILQSNGGTLFLDEIGDMPLMLQTRLLRVIEEREVVPLGSEQAIPVNLARDQRHAPRRAADDPEWRVPRGSVLPAERRHAASAAASRPRRQGGSDPTYSCARKTRARIASGSTRTRSANLMQYSWPGNIRQLRNVLRTASALCRDGLIRASNLPQEILDTEHRPAPQAARPDRIGADAGC